MRRFLRVLVIGVCISLDISDAANILAVFPTPSVSHQVIFRPLTHELARRGHRVTVITTDPVFTNAISPENLTEIDVHDVSYELWRKAFVYGLEFGRKETIYKQIETAMDIMKNLTIVQMKNDRIQQLINDKNNNFDLILIEAWPRQALIYSFIFKAPVILVSSFGLMMGNAEVLGVSNHPFLYPLILQQRLYNLTFNEKLQELYNYWWFKSTWFSKENEEINEFRKILGPTLPKYDELQNNVDMLFVNSHPMWLDNQPLPSNVISIWGIHKKPEKQLPQDLQTYLDSSKNGVIYLSFGTNAPSTTLPPEFVQLLIGVLSKLPYDVLWKWESDEMPGKSKNIKISKWFPQSDLLKHPKVKLFITQGGLQSTEEAITAGVPLVGIPMLGDQWYNIEKYEKHKIGVRLNMETITEDKFEKAIETVINDKSYKENIINLRSLMNDQPESALDRAVWWTEYVLRHGGAKHLRAAGANMPWTEYYELDFMIKLGTIVFLFTIAILFIMYVLYVNMVRKLVSNIKLKSH